ncbi:hypothetical protein [Clostridium sp. HCS.1]|uniref:hypothetical protein n=1 Tax=Clostridium sp. HCS.1 TaxID=3238594 RepID=UPI003A0FF85F
MIRNIEKSSKEIVLSKVGNIISDCDEDIIYLIGRKANEGKNTLYYEMEIVISEGSNGKLTYMDLKDIKGYNPRIILGKFSSNDKDDILFIVEEELELKGIKSIIYRFNNGKIEPIFDSNKYLLNNRYKVIYNDNYKVNLIDSNKNVNYIIDIENKDYMYLNEKYKSDGRLINKCQGQVLSPYEILQVRSNDREKFDLLLKQKIIGEDINDIIGVIVSILRFEDDNFMELNREVSIKSSKKITNPTREEFIDKKYDFSNVDFIEAEYNANLRIERAIEKEFLLNPNFDKLNYLYNRIKLNNSDKYQIIAYLEGPKFCTSRGGTIVILEEKNNDYIVTSKIKDVIPPIIVSDDINSGYHNLIVRLIKKDKLDFRVLKYNGNSYPMNPVDEEKLQSGVKVVGVAVISDDLFYKRGIEY